jgi:hypothetical protein
MHSQTQHYIKVSDKLQTLVLEKELLLPIGKEARRAPEEFECGNEEKSPCNLPGIEH